MDIAVLRDLARYQAWADAEHWKALHANPAALDDPEIRKRLNHMAQAYQILCTMASGGEPDIASIRRDCATADETEAAMAEANRKLAGSLEGLDLDKMVPFPRGPQGPFDAPAGVVILQALLHSQHHRGQNASRMRQLGITPPMTDFVIWHAKGRE